MLILSGSSNQDLAAKIARRLKTELVDADLTHFSNGEKRIWIKGDIRGQNIAIVQSLSHPVDEHIIELLMMIDAAERLGARHVNVIIPWMGYSLQDKVFRAGEPIAAKVVANLVSNSYTKRGFLLDLHNSSTPGFFSIPTTHLSTIELFADYVKNNAANDVVIASPDFGGLKRSRMLADELNVPLINIDKHRNLATGEVTALGLHGEAKGKEVYIFDDCILSGGTAVESARILKAEGASQVHFLVTHGLFVDGAAKKVVDSELDSVVVTNSIAPLPENNKIKLIDVSELFADALGTWN